MTRPHEAEQRIRELIGHNIVRARLESGLLQHQLATEANIDRSHLSAWERGRRQPSPYNLERLAATLGKPFAWFYSEHDAT